MWACAWALLGGALNPLGSEWDPTHAHVVIGGNGTERARALAAHLAEPHVTPNLLDVTGRGLAGRAAPDETCDVPGVFAVRSSGAAGLLVLEIGSVSVSPAFQGTVLPPLAARRVGLPVRHFPAGLVLQVPEPPPRIV